LGAALVIGFFRRAYAAFRGFDDETGSVPMMDGPLRPNEALDAMPVALTLADVDNLALWRDGLICSSGAELLWLARSSDGLAIVERRAFEAPLTCVAVDAGGGLAVGLDGRGVVVAEGPHAGRRLAEIGGRPLISPTAMAFDGPDRLVIANGAANLAAADWKRDLMERGASGSLWRVDLAQTGAEPELLADGLAFPCGLARAPDGALLLSEAWRHRVLRIEAAGQSAPKALVSDLPAYPGRIAAAQGGGFWLALFAPRNQLVEFVLREDQYRRRMIDGVDPAYWIAPALSSGASFLEPIQGGARKKLNRLKPWSPSWSYGLVARCDAAMRPRASFHSRADGQVHGVTSCCEWNGVVYAAARGSGCVVAINLADVTAGEIAA
jgi:hypothetical protein